MQSDRKLPGYRFIPQEKVRVFGDLCHFQTVCVFLLRPGWTLCQSRPRPLPASSGFIKAAALPRQHFNSTHCTGTQQQQQQEQEKSSRTDSFTTTALISRFLDLFRIKINPFGSKNAMFSTIGTDLTYTSMASPLNPAQVWTAPVQLHLMF